MLRSGTDINNEFRARKRAYSTQRFKLGSYREEKLFSEERNSDFLLAYAPQTNEDLSYSVSLGGNRLDSRFNLSDVSAPELAVPGIYSLNNSKVAIQSFAFNSKKRINSQSIIYYTHSSLLIIKYFLVPNKWKEFQLLDQLALSFHNLDSRIDYICLCRWSDKHY